MKRRRVAHHAIEHDVRVAKPFVVIVLGRQQPMNKKTHRMLRNLLCRAYVKAVKGMT